MTTPSSTTTTSTTTITSTPASSLQDATAKSTIVWQADLEALFNHAKDRFPDVVWALLTEQDGEPTGEQVYGHKAIIYARAPPSFQARYFSFRPAPILSSAPLDAYSPSGFPTQSALSLTLGPEVSSISRSPSPFRPASPVSQSQDGLMHLTTSINPNLFSKELEYLYTGKGLGAAFEFFYDSSEHYREEGDAEESRIDKLRKDLVFMWRSRLYSDVRIGIEGGSSSHHEGSAAIFATHRFILVSRSHYFHNALIAWNTQRPEIRDEDQDDDRLVEPPTLMLPSPPFTPPSLHFVLGFIYTGTLIFSNRTYDLDTAFHIMRSSTYISLTSLYDEVQARIVQEMMHGLFHAYVEFAEYERITSGKWGVSGCRCRQCARRIPRIIEFALLDDVKNSLLERGARRGLVGMFGEGWCNAEFAKLDKKIRDAALKGVAKRTTPLNIFPLLFAAEFALTKLNSIIDPWADTSRDMILDARRHIDHLLCSQPDECFSQSEWLELLETDGAKFEDRDHVDWIIKSIQRGFAEKSAGRLYQALVSSILLRPHPSDPNATMLSPTSLIRQRVEDTRVELLRWMKKRWVSIRMEGGFENLDPWALKEISHELELSTDDLVSPTSAFKGSPARNGFRATKHLDAEAETVSQHSLRTSLLNRNLAKHHAPTSPREPLISSSSSIRSVARSTYSTQSKISDISTTQQRRQLTNLGPRPDSKLTPSGETLARSLSRASSTSTIGEEDQDNSPTNPTTPPAKRHRPAPESSRPKSPSGSVASVRSRASTVRKHTQSTPTPSLRISNTASRPTSAVSQRSDASSTFRTTNSEFPGMLEPRPRRSSVSSTVSTASVKTTATATSTTATSPRPRRTSATSVMGSNTMTKPKKAVPPLPDPVRLSTKPAQKSPSSASLRSTASTSPSSLKKIVPRKSSPGKPGESPKARTTTVSRDTPAIPEGTVKGKGKEQVSIQPDPSPTSKPVLRVTAVSEASSSILVAPRHQRSAEAVSRSTSVSDVPSSGQPSSISSSVSPRGATLEVGIPCIITSKRARFRALARYIGEVEGELGPWVGVEVPMGDAWPGDKLDVRAWHDGTWGGVRYFDIGGGPSSGTDWDFGDDMRSTMRRKRPNGHGHGLSTIGKDGGRSLKREGGYLDAVGRVKRLRSVSPAGSDNMATESRGLFVRPQQVLYVVDAVGSDF
ncbi:hypothetical protein F5148DRAFT_528064 [Russula earlei]|uniref:Uncharacterized protein n=1 Tax=Russula earlei TaxID=71964 RepID=A0ACC0TYI3_9AGAM|nr:hypothetical protein F5148DRAFT_528064 [Russula earlei]